LEYEQYQAQSINVLRGGAYVALAMGAFGHRCVKVYFNFPSSTILLIPNFLSLNGIFWMCKTSAVSRL
jgi:hypothetical protein